VDHLIQLPALVFQQLWGALQ